VARRQRAGPRRQAHPVEHRLLLSGPDVLGRAPEIVRANGLPALVGANMERWFTKDFRERAPDVIARMTEMFLKTDIEGYVCCMEAIRDMDHRPLLPKIKAPTLVIAGRFDPATPLPGNEFIRDHIPGAKLAVLDAAHIANMELQQAYADTVLGFLLNEGVDSSTRPGPTPAR